MSRRTYISLLLTTVFVVATLSGSIALWVCGCADECHSQSVGLSEDCCDSRHSLHTCCHDFDIVNVEVQVPRGVESFQLSPFIFADNLCYTTFVGISGDSSYYVFDGSPLSQWQREASRQRPPPSGV